MSRSGGQTPGRRPRRTGVLRRDSNDLVNEQRIVDSGVRQSFTPHQPIQRGKELSGRRREIHEGIETLNTPGRHVLIINRPGLGGTSMANALAHAYAQTTHQEYVAVKHCDHLDKFESILEVPLVAAGVDPNLIEYETGHATTQKAELGPLVVARGSRERQTTLSTTHRPNGEISASRAAEYLAPQQSFLPVDKLDAVRDPTTHLKIAELVKQLSDRGSQFKLLLVGDAETATELTTPSHLSHQPLHVIKLHPLLGDDMRDIIDRGASELKLSYHDEVMDAIAWISDGYPHFTHLLALKCAEHAILSRQDHIGWFEFSSAMTAARNDADNALQTAYDATVQHQSSPAVVEVLKAAAELDDNEFNVKQLQLGVTSLPRGLASINGSTILRPIGNRNYEFTDPRMRSYIRIAHHLTGPPESVR